LNGSPFQPKIAACDPCAFSDRCRPEGFMEVDVDVAPGLEAGGDVRRAGPPPASRWSS